MKVRLLPLICILLLIDGVESFGQNQQKPPVNQPERPMASSSAPGHELGNGAVRQEDVRYKLQKNDVLMVDFTFSPEYNATATVQPDGFIALRGVKSIKAEGLTTPEVREAIRREYANVLEDPAVTVVLKQFVKPYFIAYGELYRPGRYQIAGDITATQAIGIAGGFTKDAKHSDVYLFRRVSTDWVSSQKLDIKHILSEGKLSEDPHLQAGDMLWVPKSKISKAESIRPLIPYQDFYLNFGPVNY